jgi:membrane protein
MATAERSLLQASWIVFRDAFGHFMADDGWAMASHVSLSMLLAVFPFLIFVAALAGFLGEADLPSRVAEFLFATWPKEVAGPIADEVYRVLATDHRNLLTVSAVVALYLASNGIEAVRNGLNRAYRVVDRRSIFFRRGQSIVLVLLGAAASLLLALLAVLGTSAIDALVLAVPALRAVESLPAAMRAIITLAVILVALGVAHVFLPAGRPKWYRLWPGILFTLVGWAIAVYAIGIYMATFANMAATYAGLAGVFTALFFLYAVAVLLLFGAELNAALSRLREGLIG